MLGNHHVREQFCVPSYEARSAAGTLYVVFKRQTVQSFMIQRDYCDVVCLCNLCFNPICCGSSVCVCTAVYRAVNKINVMNKTHEGKGWRSFVTSLLPVLYLLHTEVPLIYCCMQGIFAFFAICSINFISLPTSLERVLILNTDAAIKPHKACMEMLLTNKKNLHKVWTHCALRISICCSILEERDDFVLNNYKAKTVQWEFSVAPLVDLPDWLEHTALSRSESELSSITLLRYSDRDCTAGSERTAYTVANLDCKGQRCMRVWLHTVDRTDR